MAIVGDMKRILLVLLLASALVAGCDPLKSSSDAGKAEPGTSTAGSGAGTSAETGSQGGITPMAGVGGGPMAPVSGAETVTGSGGGGVGMAAKEKAKGVAGSSPSSLNQMREDGN